MLDGYIIAAGIVCGIGVLLWLERACFGKVDSADAGTEGEALVATELCMLPNEIYKVVNNVFLPTVDGATTQIDHVVVSRYGVFVIETKCYGGWIFGDEKGRKWTQSIGNSWDASKYHFQNPIRQNWRHICTMAHVLKLPRRYFFNTVVFCGDGEFMTEMPENVMHISSLISYIKKFDQVVMSDVAAEKIVRTLILNDCSIGEEERAAHVLKAQAAHDPAQLSVAWVKGELRCPKCGAKMVLRHRRSDGAPFYGCSEYPRCTGIRNAEGKRE